MADGLDQLEQELVIDLLKSWIKVYDMGEKVYESAPADVKAWVDEHGHEVETLVPVVAFMKPHVRVVCRSLVENGLTDMLSKMSHPVGTVLGDDLVETREGGTVSERDLESEVDALRREISELRRLLEHHLETCPGTRSEPSARPLPREES